MVLLARRMGLILDNPIVLKEMRIGFREKKIFVALILWIIILSIIASLVASTMLAQAQSISDYPEVGRSIFEALFWSQLILLGLFCPSLTSGAITGERERQSLDMLLVTKLTPTRIVFGKLAFAVSFIMLALFLTSPLEATVFFLGGVSLASFLWAKLILLVIAAITSSFALLASARETRTTNANAQTYLLLVLLSFFAIPCLSILRYDHPPLSLLIFCALTATYLIGYSFLKSASLLEEKGQYSIRLLKLALAYYLSNLILIAIIIYKQTHGLYTQDIAADLYTVAIPTWAIFNYLALGALLNPILPQSIKAREQLQQSILSSPLTWISLISIGIIAPFLSLFTSFHEQALVILFYTLLSSLGAALLARRLASKKASRYPYYLLSLWTTLNIIPVLFTARNIGIEEICYHPATISPAYFLSLLSPNTPTATADLPILACTFYGLLVLGSIRSLWPSIAYPAKN